MLNQILMRSVSGGCDDEFAYSMSGIIADSFLLLLCSTEYSGCHHDHEKTAVVPVFGCGFVASVAKMNVKLF